MTVGEKIRYFRKRLGITQDELAKRADLHPVSIRKYETNKMIPQYEQIEKLATALKVNASALSNATLAHFRLHTIGDLMSLLITLCESDILIFDGNRNSEGLIDQNSAVLSINSRISQFFSLNFSSSTEALIPLSQISAKLDNPSLLEAILLWEKERYLSRYHSYRLMNHFSKEDLALHLQAEERKELAELELQKSTEKLPWPNEMAGDMFIP